MNKDQAKQEIQALIDEFASKEAFYKDKNYAEENIKVNFITPFFRALGWDIENKQSREVIFEDRTRIEGRIKRPDYGFYLNNKRQFFVEAKAAHEDLKNNWSLAHQLKAYGWSSKLKISILTDFEEFAVYDCRYYPERLEECSLHRIKYINYKNYLNEFEYIWNNFSREAVLNGSIDKLVKDIKNIEKEAVDKKFLDFLEQERIRLAGEIAKLNPSIQEFELNKALVKLINRIVFLRIAEDRDIEIYGELKDLKPPSPLDRGSSEIIYTELKILFARANEKYNSEMFELDKTDLELKIKDQVLYHFIENLYYPNSPYIFDAISIDVLGSVYERFLGSVVVLENPLTPLTGGNVMRKVIVEQKPEVRKAGGVYYTPKYIVDYIVENTIGELIQKPPSPLGRGSLKNKITPKEISTIKILDPACGSGSFLIGAYEYLLDWHLKYYTQASIKEQKDNIDFVEGKPKLTIKVKKEILLNNIFGVDIDEQAINVTKLSLCLKSLEGETQHSLRTQLALFKTQALPTLKNNIKCGNSLISSDFAKYELGFNKWNEDEQRKINPFNWEREFKDIMKNGGFDAVIGNPPYVDYRLIGNEQVNYLNQKYESTQTKEKWSIYIPFVEKAKLLLKPDGIYGNIIPNTFLSSDFGKPLRKFLLNNVSLIEITDVSYLKVFGDVGTYPILFFYQKKTLNENHEIRLSNIMNIEYLSDKTKNFETINQNEIIRRNQNYVLSTAYTKSNFDFLLKLEKLGTPLKDLIEKFAWGTSISGFKSFKIKESDFIKLSKIQQEKYAKVIQTADIKRYGIFWTNEYIDKTIYSQNVQQCFKQEKIVIARLTKTIQSTIDTENYFMGKSSFILNPKVPSKYLIALLNSNLLNYYFYIKFSNTHLQGGYLRFDIPYLEKLPIMIPKSENKQIHEQIIKLVDEILALNEQKKTASEYQIERILQPQIDDIDKEIDKLVYELYDLTDQEIKIVEGI